MQDLGNGKKVSLLIWNESKIEMPKKSGKYLVAIKNTATGNYIFSHSEYSAKHKHFNCSDDVFIQSLAWDENYVTYWAELEEIK